jgi:hypothetical protein
VDLGGTRSGWLTGWLRWRFRGTPGEQTGKEHDERTDPHTAQGQNRLRPADDRGCDRRGVRGDHAAVAVLSATKGGTASNAIAFGTFGVVVAAVAVTLGRAGGNLRLDAFLSRLQDTTAEIRVRIAVALLIGFVALAAKVGLQIILGAFLARTADSEHYSSTA